MHAYILYHDTVDNLILISTMHSVFTGSTASIWALVWTLDLARCISVVTVD